MRRCRQIWLRMTVLRHFTTRLRRRVERWRRNAVSSVKQCGRAVVPEVRPPDARGHVEVVVRVRNGVLYASVDLRPEGARAVGTITLMTSSPRGTQDIVRTLVEGC